MLVTFWLHQEPALDPWLIIPGKSVGFITANSTTKDLSRIYGEEKVRSSLKCFLMEGMFHPCILLFENTDREMRIILGERRYVEIHGDTRWHTSEGIHIGSTVYELEYLNGEEFEFSEFNACGPEGYISSWREGKLASSLKPTDIQFFLSNYRQNESSGSFPLSHVLPENSRVIYIKVMLNE